MTRRDKVTVQYFNLLLLVKNVIEIDDDVIIAFVIEVDQINVS
jgi:hypothetical protein